MHSVGRATGTPKDRDEVNRRDESALIADEDHFFSFLSKKQKRLHAENGRVSDIKQRWVRGHDKKQGVCGHDPKERCLWACPEYKFGRFSVV